MQRKFLGIIMKHLNNSHNRLNIMKIQKCMQTFLLMMTTIVLLSCSHFLYHKNKTKTTSDKLSQKIFVDDNEKTQEATEQEDIYKIYAEAYRGVRKEIYCTPEDKQKGKKELVDHLHIACGLTKIQPTKDKTLEIQRIVLGIERHKGFKVQIGHHLLILKSGNKVLKKIQIEKEGYDPFWYEVAFVKIRKGVYWSDINNDSHLEFAVLRKDTGKAVYRTADLYTLKDNSFHLYGKGMYIWSMGGHVLLNCPDCWGADLEACKKCL